MDNQKVDNVVLQYQKQLLALGIVANRYPSSEKLPTKPQDRGLPSLSHALWMCNEVLSWDQARLPKKFRWLGFIQGIFWMNNVMPVDEAKQHNMPEGETFKS